MHRTARIAVAGLLSGVLALIAASSSVEAQFPSSIPGSTVNSKNATAGAGGVQISLKDQLEKGLKARRPVEFAFLDRVAQAVDTGLLPRSLVDSTFNWARKKPVHKVQYFQFALQAQTKRLGILF